MNEYRESLELGSGLLLDAQDNGVGSSNTDGGVALMDGLEGILYLEEVAVWGEDGDAMIIASHESIPEKSPELFQGSSHSISLLS